MNSSYLGIQVLERKPPERPMQEASCFAGADSQSPGWGRGDCYQWEPSHGVDLTQTPVARGRDGSLGPMRVWVV